jgi:tetratricopeptide (TPR) repeat protein
MSSIIEGYNYDIFISYRQKDNQPTPGYGWQNKGERWVSEFVEALKTELESTFKEEISVYFDINPHDGLLETHDVNASLKDKLKCLVFIPIISRTYCDPKSFAWEHEFKAFVEQAAHDQFGLKVKLPNGNVANRILPIRIHDLDAADIKECESVIGGVLRGVEFIYKEAGFNKPLKYDDDEKINLNKTKYRNQITKVALAIKEIILGMTTEPPALVKKSAQHADVLEKIKKGKYMKGHEKPDKLNKSKLFTGVSILAILIIAAIFSYPEIFHRFTMEKLRSSRESISVVIMPFQNLTKDTAKNFWQEMIQDNIINSLSNSEELKIRQSESIMMLLQNNGITNYALITPSAASSISQKLDANFFIYGRINQIGAIIRLNAKLINSETEDVFKSFQIDGTPGNILNIADSLSVMIKNYLIISKLAKEDNYTIVNLASTNSPEAYRYYIYGQKAFKRLNFPVARQMFQQALNIDSSFTTAAFMLSYAYFNQRIYDQGKIWCLKVFKKMEQMTPLQKIRINSMYADYFETPYEKIMFLKQHLEIDNQNPRTYYALGLAYLNIYQYDNAIRELEKVLAIYGNWHSKPMWIHDYDLLGFAYHKTGLFEKETKLYEKAEEDFPDNPDLIYRQAILLLTKANDKDAIRYIKKYISVLKDNSQPEADIATDLARLHWEAELPDKAEEYFRQALSSEPENPERLNNLAYFMIDNDRNIIKGLSLIGKALELSPDNYESLHIKGWGLYKQSKYQEALEILQKSWDIRMKNAIYNHEAYLHLEAAKKAVADQKNN